MASVWCCDQIQPWRLLESCRTVETPELTYFRNKNVPTMSNGPDKDKCQASDCNKDWKKLCSRCENGYYCSEECQRLDWSKHKVTCNTFCFAECLQHGHYRCCGCLKVRYCSADCQRSDWENHRPKCVKYDSEMLRLQRNTRCIECFAEVDFEGYDNFCEGCTDMLYCSKECRSRHWDVGGHKYSCSNVRKGPGMKILVSKIEETMRNLAGVKEIKNRFLDGLEIATVGMSLEDRNTYVRENSHVCEQLGRQIQFLETMLRQSQLARCANLYYGWRKRVSSGQYR